MFQEQLQTGNCKFCGQRFSLRNLDSHQDVCYKRPRLFSLKRIVLALLAAALLGFFTFFHPNPPPTAQTQAPQAQVQQQPASQQNAQEDPAFASVTNRTCTVDGNQAELSPDETPLINKGKFWYIHYRGKTAHVQLGVGPGGDGEDHVEFPAKDGTSTVFLRYNNHGFTRCTIEPKQ